MTTKQKAEIVLKSLYESGTFNETSGHWADGADLYKLTQLNPQDLNDAVAILEPSQCVKVLKAMGTVPYRFLGVAITPHGKVVWEEALIRTQSSAKESIAAKTNEGFHSGSEREKPAGTHVFIGHGGSSTWKDLRDFVRDRLHLPWDEFNRVPVAGVTNIDRLSQMLDSAAIAFLIMTAEDELADGRFIARMNVVHEAGLFQGRLGFKRAIILLEEGCEEFTNVEGLGQIRFSKGNIAAVFEEIRRVLEREKLIE